MLKRFGLGLMALLIVGLAPAFAQPSGISQKVGVCDPKFAANCLKPTSGGTIPVTVNSNVTATAAAPTYVEGSTDNPISSDLHGSQRSLILNAAGTAVDWTQPVVVKGNGTAGIADSAPVTVQGIASMTPVLVAGTGTAGTAATAVVTVQGIASGVAQPISGTVTANGGGTAGAANAGVLSVQGIASMTPLLATLQTQTDTVMVGGVNVKEINAVPPLMGNGATGTGALRVTPSDDITSAAINVSTATTTQIVAAGVSKVIHVKNWNVVVGAADNLTWESADTGGACANPVVLTGAYNFAANGGASIGSGAGDVLVLPSGKALCLLTSAAQQASGSVAYTQY